MRLFHIYLAVAVAFASSIGCATTSDSAGTLQIPLVQSDGAGTQYRLSARFAVSGPDETLIVDGAIDAPAVTLALSPGAYTVTVLDGWHLERSVDGQPFEPLVAQLGSLNPTPVTIAPGGSATVVFFFLIDVGDHGNLTITFGVFPLDAQLIGTLRATDASDALAGYVEHPPTFVLSYGRTFFGTRNIPLFLRVAGSSLDELRFTDDPLGLLASRGSISGGSLDYRIEVEPDESQVLLLTYISPDGALFLAATAFPLVPRLPVDPIGVPAEPGRVGLRTSAPFMFSAGDLGSMSGTVDLQFAPRG